MGIEKFIKKMNQKSKFKWVHTRTIPYDDIGFCYEIVASDDFGLTHYYKISYIALSELDFEDKLFKHFEAEMIERQMIFIYKMFTKMTPSMQKAVVDIMKTQEKQSFDELNDIGENK